MSDTIYFTFGRMNPPNAGHERLINNMLINAKKEDAMHLIILSRKCNYNNDPLDFWTKYKYLKALFPEANIHTATDERPTFFEWLDFLSINCVKGEHKNLVIVGGTDRITMWRDLAIKYNNREGHYSFDNIRTLEIFRNDKTSSTLMREYAKNNDFDNFKKLAPIGLTSNYLEEMFEDVKSVYND